MRTFEEAKKLWSVENSLAGYWYPEAWKRSERIVDLLRRFHVPYGCSITEFGVGGRRNLIALFDAGWKTVAGYDITDRLDVFKEWWTPFCTIIIDDDPHKMPICDVCITLGTLQHVTDEQRDSVMDAITTRTSQLILICENEIDQKSGQYAHDWIELFKQKGWSNFFWMPAHEVDGLDSHYVWRMFRRV